MQIDHKTPLAIIDLETTGTSPSRHRVIEVGIIRVEEGKVVRRYSTLVNPDAAIPPAITSLTGISTVMVEDAPRFEEVALEVQELLDGALFVAHNAHFDYGFITEEFRRLEMRFNAPYLCSVRLSRHLFPQWRHHNLDALMSRFGITSATRHRALDDALIVYDFLEAVEKAEGRERLYEAITDVVKVRRLPPHLSEQQLSTLPDTPGVYLFYGDGDALLYVGKSRRIRTRVRSHFTADLATGRGREMLEETIRVEHRETAGELGALLLESHLIKTLEPAYNRLSRKKKAFFIAFEQTTREGYASLRLEYRDRITPDEYGHVVGIFKNKLQAQELLRTVADAHELCPHLLGLEWRQPCFQYQIEKCRGACVGAEKSRTYNRRFREAFADMRLKSWPFKGAVVVEEKIRERKGELFIIDNWRLLTALSFDEGEWEELVPATFSFDYDAYKILARHLLRKHPRVTIRDLTSREEAWLQSDTVGEKRIELE